MLLELVGNFLIKLIFCLQCQISETKTFQRNRLITTNLLLGRFFSSRIELPVKTRDTLKIINILGLALIFGMWGTRVQGLCSLLFKSEDWTKILNLLTSECPELEVRCYSGAHSLFSSIYSPEAVSSCWNSERTTEMLNMA